MNGKSLHRDPVNGKLAGVCAGIANYFEIETWLVRIMVVSAGLLGAGFFVVLIYIALALMLEKQPYQARPKTQQQDHKLKNKPWQSGGSPSQVIDNLQREFDELEGSIQKMEAYVTSETFKVQREFNKL